MSASVKQTDAFWDQQYFVEIYTFVFPSLAQTRIALEGLFVYACTRLISFHTICNNCRQCAHLRLNNISLSVFLDFSLPISKPVIPVICLYRKLPFICCSGATFSVRFAQILLLHAICYLNLCSSVMVKPRTVHSPNWSRLTSTDSFHLMQIDRRVLSHVVIENSSD